nr:CopD family protein [Actinokineospora sp. NBRC 105648]
MRLSALLAVLACWAVLAAPPALAHVEVVGSTPVGGARLAGAPSVVSVRLSENVGIQKDALRVVDARGQVVSDGPVFQPGEVAEEMAVRLRPGLGDGTYLVQYAFVSADTHPVRGGFAFVVGDGPLMNASGAVSDTTDNGSVAVLTKVVRWVGYLGVALAGGVLFLLYCRPRGTADPRARALMLGGCALAAVGGVLTLGMEGAHVTGADLSRVFAPELVANTLDSAYGKLLVLRVVAALGLAFVARRLFAGPPPRLRSRYENLAMVSGFLLLLTSAAAGHAIAAEVMFVTLLADLAHYGAVAVWLGGVVQLALCAWRPQPEEDLGAVMARFSSVAKVSVAVIVISGGLLGVAYVGSVAALVDTPYGLLLLGKLAGFALLLVLADRCRRAVRQGLTGTSGSTLVGVRVGTLRRVLAAEVVVAAAVLAVAAVVATTAPPP